MPTLRLGISNQGDVSTSGAIIYQPTAGYRATIHNIKFSNTALSPFQLTLSLHRSSTGTTVQIYYFELDAGDVVMDDGVYELFDGDYLFADTDVSDTVFTMNGIELFETPIPV